MFTDFKRSGHKPVYLQVKDYLKELILKGILQAGVRLPSTREMGLLLEVSRNTVIQAYQYLEDDGFIHTVKGQGAFVTGCRMESVPSPSLNWAERVTGKAQRALELDIEKKELRWEKGMISFKSIAPDQTLFEMEEFKRSLANRIALEGEKLLNYGYARGYKPLLEYLSGYMENKGVCLAGKDLLVTNGFTEALNLILTAVSQPGDEIVCENPTHNTALKIMKLAGLKITGVTMNHDGIDLQELEEVLSRGTVKLGYLIPSYQNPTGLVMSPEKRLAVFGSFEKYRVPIIEDGFNEELRYSGSHVAPLLALSGTGNNLIYLGSFSKILFPGLRLGWIVGDAVLISYLESLKRSMNIHTSFLDQAILYEYLHNGYFEKYLKKVRKVYKERHQLAVELARELIPHRRIWGEGGLHIFVELEQDNAREVLAACYRRGVLFMPGDIFYTNGGGGNTFRLGISRTDPEMMRRGFAIIGEEIKRLQS